jgi:hypothetical protein
MPNAAAHELIAYVEEGVELIMTRLREGMSYQRSVQAALSSLLELDLAIGIWSYVRSLAVQDAHVVQ